MKDLHPEPLRILCNGRIRIGQEAEIRGIDLTGRQKKQLLHQLPGAFQALPVFKGSSQDEVAGYLMEALLPAHGHRVQDHLPGGMLMVSKEHLIAA